MPGAPFHSDSSIVFIDVLALDIQPSSKSSVGSGPKHWATGRPAIAHLDVQFRLHTIISSRGEHVEPIAGYDMLMDEASIMTTNRSKCSSTPPLVSLGARPADRTYTCAAKPVFLWTVVFSDDNCRLSAPFLRQSHSPEPGANHFFQV